MVLSHCGTIPWQLKNSHAIPDVVVLFKQMSIIACLSLLTILLSRIMSSQLMHRIWIIRMNLRFVNIHLKNILSIIIILNTVRILTNYNIFFKYSKRISIGIIWQSMIILGYFRVLNYNFRRWTCLIWCSSVTDLKKKKNYTEWCSQ